MLTNPIQVLSETELLGHKFTVYGTAENPLFLAKEVAECIDYAKRSNGSYNTTMMLQSVDEEEKVANIVDTPGGNQQVWFLTEDGLYEVLMQSRKPIAKEFNYVEGCGSVIGDTSLVNHVHVYNITLKDSGSLRGGTGIENKITYCTVFGTIVQNIGNNGLLVSGTEIKDIELINARIKIKVTDAARQVGYSLYYKSVTNSNAIENLKICNSIIEWEMPENFTPTTAIFVSIDNTLDNAKCAFNNVIFASNKNLLLGRVDTVHFTNSLFSNVILAGVSKSDVLQDCMEISKNDYDYSCLVSKASVNNGVLVE